MIKNKENNFLLNMARLALPIALQQLLVSCAQLVDTAMVTSLGNVTVSAVGVSSRWIFLMNLFYFGISSGSAAMISQFWGAKEKSNIRKACGAAMIMSLAVAFIFCFAMACFPEQLLRVFTNEAAVITEAAKYMRIIAFMGIFSAFNQIACTVLRATEKVNPPLFSSIIAVAVNTTLNYLLIFGKFGFPQLGIRGAALASLISAMVQSVILLFVLKGSKEVFKAPIKEFLNLSREFIKKFVSVCMPVVINEGIWAIGTNIYAMVFARQGSENYAGYTIFSSIEQVAFVFFVGICHACSIMTGKTIGEGKENEAYKLAKKFVIMTPLIGIFTGSILAVCREPLLSLLNIETQAAFELASKLVLIYCLWLPIRNIPYTLIVGTFRAGGDTKTGIVCDCVSMYLIGVPLVVILGMFVKVEFHYLLIAMYLGEDLLKSVLSLYHFKTKKWIKNLTDKKA
ncbi:MAG: MATE family efflux transporter [Clostridia bacterium]|nr:MATE family efflux transporter [Clostridia bacterium]